MTYEELKQMIHDDKLHELSYDELVNYRLTYKLLINTSYGINPKIRVKGIMYVELMKIQHALIEELRKRYQKEFTNKSNVEQIV